MKLFGGAADTVTDFYPKLQLYLNAIDVDVDAATFIVIGLKNVFLIAFLTAALLAGLSFAAGELVSFAPFTTAATLVMFAATLLYWLFYPAVQARKKARQMEQELLFALRDLSIEISAGTPFNDALRTLTNGYGVLSDEMSLVVKDIETGVPVDKALYNSLNRNTGEIYRSTILRLVNGIRSGTSIPSLLNVVIENLSTKLENAVTKYGENVNTWSTLYLVVGIVLPSMGFTVFVLLSAFTGTPISQTFIYLASALLVLFHVFAIGLLNSRRPSVEM